MSELENREISKLKDELSKNKVHVSEIESKLEMSKKSHKNLQEKLSKAESDNKTMKFENEKKIKSLEIDLQVPIYLFFLYVTYWHICFRMKRKNWMFLRPILRRNKGIENWN